MKSRELLIVTALFLTLGVLVSAQETAPPPAAETTKPPEVVSEPAADTTKAVIDMTEPTADTAKSTVDTLQKAKPKESLISLDQPGAGVSKYFLHEIIVTANRYEKSSFKTPASVSVLNHERIEKSDPDIIADLFRNLPGVELNDAGPFAPRPVIRGLFGSRVLLLADGERLNDTRESSFSGAQLSLVDVDEIERVEVVNGPGTVLYGTDALGGVINLITSRVKFNEDDARAD